MRLIVGIAIGFVCGFVGALLGVSRLYVEMKNRITKLESALAFIRGWFEKLEAGQTDDDPLAEFRRKFHAPVYEAIASAFAKNT